MSTEKLKELETRLAESEDFMETLSFFMDNFGDKPSFTRDSKKTKAPLVVELIHAGAVSFFKKIPVNIIKLVVMSYDRLSIIHGGGFVEGQMLSFFYCKRINKGMLIIASKTGSIEMIRITPQPLDDKKLDTDFIDSIESVTKHFRNENPN